LDHQEQTELQQRLVLEKQHKLYEKLDRLHHERDVKMETQAVEQEKLDALRRVREAQEAQVEMERRMNIKASLSTRRAQLEAERHHTKELARLSAARRLHEQKQRRTV
jgi:hypothetical protein